MRRFLGVVLAAAVLGAVGAVPATAGNGGKGDEPTLESADDTRAKRTKGYERTIEIAIDDIQEFWSDTFPDIYGEKYDVIPDSRIFAAHPGIELPKCQGQTLTYSDAEDNAFYCYKSNFVAYDDVKLFPQLYRDFGDFALALVLAHEWGHAVQDRAENEDQQTVYKELQADCFAGSWTQHVADGESKLELKGGTLDKALAAMLEFRDAPGSSPDDPGAHGSGFDRVAAFQQGYEDSAEQCAAYFDSPPVITEIPFTDEQDAASGGNLEADLVLPASVELLNDFYSQVEAAYEAKTIDDVYSFDSSGSGLPECGGTELPRKVVKNRIFYCIDDGYFAFDEPYLQHVYEDIGDMGVLTLLANSWATYVQLLQGFPGADENADNAVLGADCYTGGFAAAMYNEALASDTLGGSVVLSPGDLDETVQAFIDYAAARGLSADIDVTFVRISAFRSGFFNGYDTCQSVYADSDIALG